ncbi:hypothetical protein VTJ49DRAFT_3093 [Mycothermus thermophilus]|uniref:Transmembrane protein n=1 Tax=Humicola insolens TaxID=85995 RepID=A0ABR3V8E1_HUMIN
MRECGSLVRALAALEPRLAAHKAGLCSYAVGAKFAFKSDIPHECNQPGATPCRMQVVAVTGPCSVWASSSGEITPELGSMGAYVSTENCIHRYGVEPNCQVVLSQDNQTALQLGDSKLGTFNGDPDIAGAGVLGAFFCVTAVSVFLGFLSMLWWCSKNILGMVNRLTREEKTLKNWQLSVSGILEAIIITCSDQQIFTGGAYAITLRYAKACNVSAYHYNIVANILLVTCATHLMAITVARHYWEHPYVGTLRLIVTTLVYVITGTLLSKQGSGSLGFPTEIPSYSSQYSLMLLPAACFQRPGNQIGSEFERAFRASSAAEFFTGQVHGRANYVIMLLFYCVAVCVSLGRVVRRGLGHDGKRNKFVARMKQKVPFLFRIRRALYMLFAVYLVAGIALTAWTVAIAAKYVFELRRWVDKSGWIQKSNNQNPENDPSTFGQLVPLLLMSLTLFTFMQILSERIRARRRREKHRKYNSLRHNKDSNSPSPDSGMPFSSDLGLNAQSVPVGQFYDAAAAEKYKSEPTVTVNATQPSSMPPAGNGTPAQSQSAFTLALPPIRQQTYDMSLAGPAFETIPLDADPISPAPNPSGNGGSTSSGAATPGTGVAVNTQTLRQTTVPATGPSPQLAQTSAPTVVHSSQAAQTTAQASISSPQPTQTSSPPTTTPISPPPPPSRTQTQPTPATTQSFPQPTRSETDPTPQQQQPQQQQSQMDMYTTYMYDQQQTPWDSQPAPSQDQGHAKLKKKRGLGGLFSRSKTTSNKTASESEPEPSPWAGGVYYGSGSVPNSAPLYGSYPITASPPTFYSPNLTSTGGMGAAYWPVGQQHQHMFPQSLSAASLPAFAGGAVVGLGLDGSTGGDPAQGHWFGRSNTEPMGQGQQGQQWLGRSQTDPVAAGMGVGEGQQGYEGGNGWVQVHGQQQPGGQEQGQQQQQQHQQ